MNTTTLSESAAITAATAVKPLNTKAMLVKLTTTKPAMSRRDKAAETIIQAQLDDTSLVVASKLFKDKANPVRRLLNDAAAIYAYHIQHTMPWTDRGPRLLPVDRYDEYNAEMRKLMADVEAATAKLMPQYDHYVQLDIAARGDRAAIEDYPSAETFQAKLQFKFFFQPLPDASHYLFDVNQEDKDALAAMLDEARHAANKDLAARLHDPLTHLVKKLQVSIGGEGGIFRDSAVQNIVEACEIVESLAMGDEIVLSMVQDLRRAIRPLALAPDVVRESPVERSQAAARLAEVASKMSTLFGG